MNEEIKYFSMFTGIGGFELGLGERFRPVGFSEIDKYACKLLSDKFPNVKNYGDATKIKPEELPDFDMLCGGFPCQAFSLAGKQLGFKDTRGTLFYEIARIIKSKRPKLVFLENVKNLLFHDKGRTFTTILAVFDELGYNVEWQCINSKHFGVPQSRERVIIIGHSRETGSRQILPIQPEYNYDFRMLQTKRVQNRKKKRQNYTSYKDSKRIMDANKHTKNWEEYIYDT